MCGRVSTSYAKLKSRQTGSDVEASSQTEFKPSYHFPMNSVIGLESQEGISMSTSATTANTFQLSAVKKEAPQTYCLS